MLSRKTRVYLTVDVETSMGGAWRYPDRRPVSIDKAIFCKRDGVSYGLPLIVGELNKHGFRATFFTEMFFSHCLGGDQAKVVVDYLLNGGQDVQLHMHPVFRYHSLAVKEGTSEAFARYRALGDALNEKNFDTQFALLSEASDLFRSLVGDRARAFRAGGFLGDRNTLVALRRLEIPIDSSYNPSIAASFANSRPLPNVIQSIDGIIEIPLTTALSGLNGFRRWKPMAISSLSLSELITVLNQARAAQIRDVVLIFHSFSTVKPRDMFYSSFRPDRMVISRFRRLLQYLADHADSFDVCTMGNAAESLEHFIFDAASHNFDLGFIKPAIRKGAQALNRLYWI